MEEWSFCDLLQYVTLNAVTADGNCIGSALVGSLQLLF